MAEQTLILIYKDQHLELPVRAYPYGFTYRLEVKAGDDLITFEPDEEGSYRAFADEKTDKKLLRMIAVELEKLK